MFVDMEMEEDKSVMLKFRVFMLNYGIYGNLFFGMGCLVVVVVV